MQQWIQRVRFRYLRTSQGRVNQASVACCEVLAEAGLAIHSSVAEIQTMRRNAFEFVVSLHMDGKPSLGPELLHALRKYLAHRIELHCSLPADSVAVMVHMHLETKSLPVESVTRMWLRDRVRDYHRGSDQRRPTVPEFEPTVPMSGANQSAFGPMVYAPPPTKPAAALSADKPPTGPTTPQAAPHLEPSLLNDGAGTGLHGDWVPTQVMA